MLPGVVARDVLVRGVRSLRRARGAPPARADGGHDARRDLPAVPPPRAPRAAAGRAAAVARARRGAVWPLSSHALTSIVATGVAVYLLVTYASMFGLGWALSAAALLMQAAAIIRS